MRICFVALFSYPLFQKGYDGPFGGAEIQLFNIGNELKKRGGVGVSFIVGDFGQQNREQHDGITLIRSIKPGPRHNPIQIIISFIYQINSLYKAESDIFVKRAAGVEVFILALFCKLFKKKFIFMTAHDADCNGDFRKQNPFEGLLYEWGMRQADAIVTQSLYQKDALKSRYDLRSNIIKSGYPLNSLDQALDREFILWVARLEPWKQPELMIKIAQDLPNEKFVMIAPDANDPKYAERIRKKLELVGNIELHLRVPFHRISNYFKRAKLFINTSSNEGFPNTFIQAMMCGTPIVSLNVNPDKIIETAGVGFSTGGDQNMLVCGIRELLKNERMWEEQSANGRKYVKSKHNIETVCDDLMGIIRNL